MIIRNLLNKAVALFTHAFIMGHCYRLWSLLHRAIYDRKYRDVPLLTLTVDQASWKMESFRWEYDGFNEFGDAVCSPQKVTAVGFKDENDPNMKGPKPGWCPELLWRFYIWLTWHGNDCDEEAIFLVNSLVDPQIQSAEFMSVGWYNPDKSRNAQNSGYMGHNVCLLRQMEMLRYMDYGTPGDYHASEDAVAQDVVKRYTNGRGVLLCWHVSDKNLVPLRGKIVV